MFVDEIFLLRSSNR